MKAQSLLLGLPLALLLESSCATRDLSESWNIDRLRILAVRPEPAEAHPGDTITFESLIVSPDSPVETVLWFGCLPEEASSFGCDVDMSALMGDEGGFGDPSEMDPEDLAALYEKMKAAGLIGIEPFFPPIFQVPASALDGRDEWERQQGLNVFVQIVAIPADATSDKDIEIAYKRVPVSDAESPNENPTIASLRVDGLDIPPGAILELDSGQAYELEVLLTKESIEQYVYLTSTGEWEDRVEEPYFTFYFESGDIDQSIALYPESAIEWTTPARPEKTEQTFWVVVRDRRGGMAWWSQNVRLR